MEIQILLIIAKLNINKGNDVTVKNSLYLSAIDEYATATII